MTQIQALIFVSDQFIEPAVFFEEVEIVKAGYKKNIPDSSAHQVLKALETRSVSVFDPVWIQMSFVHGSLSRK